MVTLIELADVGRKMRDAQKEYFRTKSSIAKANAKRLEKKFDEMLKEPAVPESADNQSRLF